MDHEPAPHYSTLDLCVDLAATLRGSRFYQIAKLGINLQVKDCPNEVNQCSLKHQSP